MGEELDRQSLGPPSSGSCMRMTIQELGVSREGRKLPGRTQPSDGAGKQGSQVFCLEV
jgi:hypothetical protein